MILSRKKYKVKTGCNRELRILIHDLGKAIEIRTGCGADGWVEKYEKELASLA
jgi:hypothetical protein